MTVYFSKTRKKWRFHFELAGHRYTSHPQLGAYFATKKEAKAAEVETRVIMRRMPASANAPTEVTMLEVLEMFARSVQGTANFGNVLDHVEELLGRPEFSPNKAAREVTEQDIRDYIAWARRQVLKVWIGGPDRKLVERRPREQLYRPHKHGKTRSNSTINHYLATLRAAMNMAHATYNPVTNTPMLPRAPRIPKLNVPERLPRPISDASITSIIRAAGKASAKSKRTYRKHLVHAILLCRMMGFRKAEVFTLVRDRVDFENSGYWLLAESTKGNRDEFVPAGPQAMKLLAWLCRRAAALGQERLILYRDPDGSYRPIKDARSAWRAVRRDLGLNHVFHNTKASYVTAVARAGGTRATIQKAGRHADYKTTERYLQVVDQDLRTAVDRADFSGRTRTQNPHPSATAPEAPRNKVIK